MLRQRPRLFSTVYWSWSLPDCSKVTRPSTCDQIVSMWKVCLFAYNMTVILYTLWFSMVTVFICSNHGLCLNNFSFCMMGKKYMLSLLFAILVLCNRVESSKITSYFKLFWTKYFHFGWHNVSTYFRRFVKTDWQIIHKFTVYSHYRNTYRGN